MIYFLLTLFLVSLLAIVIMLWRRIALVKSGNYYIPEGASFEIPYLKEAKKISIKNAKRYEYLILVVIVKYSLQFYNFLKNKYKELNTKIQNIHLKNRSTGELIEKVEASKLLKIAGAYKKKIGDIAKKIKEEEKEEKSL